MLLKRIRLRFDMLSEDSDIFVEIEQLWRRMRI